MRAALYARVSKGKDQDPTNQTLMLEEWAQRTGAETVGPYVDRATTRDTRPEKERILGLARTGQIDAIVFVSLDRWGRTMDELILEITEMRQRNVSLISLKEGLSFDGAAGMLHAHILAAFAAFERERIRERTLWGLARARAQGKRLGRPRKNPPLQNQADSNGEAGGT